MDFGEEHDTEYDEKPKKKITVGKVLLYIVYVFFALFIILITWRMINFNSDRYKNITANTELVYSTSDYSSVSALTCKPSAELSQQAYFKPYGFVYFPDLGQVQVTLRLNKSLYRRSSMPEDTVFTFTLNDDTNDKEYAPDYTETNEDSRYIYKHLTFLDAPVSDCQISIRMYKPGETVAMDQAVILSEGQEFKIYKLTSSDIDVLKSFH